MFVTKLFHDAVVDGLESNNEKLIKINHELRLTIEKLEKELKEARALESVLKKLADKWTDKIHSRPNTDWFISGGYTQIHPVNHYAQLITDFATKKDVLKHEALTTCIKISKNGTVTEGKTVQKPDKGYTYKLIRE